MSVAHFINLSEDIRITLQQTYNAVRLG